MVAKDFGGGGLLKLSVDNSEPPFSVDSLTVDSSGSVDSQAGVAYVRGTVTCSQGPGHVWINLSSCSRSAASTSATTAASASSATGRHHGS